MKPALLIMLLVALVAVCHAQTSSRPDPSVLSEMPEQRRHDLRAVLKTLPFGSDLDNQGPSSPDASRRRLTEDERARLRQQLRLQDGESMGQGSRAPMRCGRGPANQTNRTPNDNC